MAKYTINDTTLTSIADAIRAKGGTTAALTPAQMAEAIAAIQAGGGGSGAWYQTGEITFAEELSNSTHGWILPIDDSNGVPEVVGVFRKATATESSLTDNMLCAVAAPKLMPYAYVYGQTGKYNTHYPDVINNDKAINKKNYGTSQYGNYAVVMPAYAQDYKLRAGDTYIWFAIGGLPE